MSKFTDKLEEGGMNLKSWPHQFTKTGGKEQIGEDKTFLPDGEHAAKVYAEEMVCVHCHARYWSRKESPPIGMCPARNKQREIKRLLS